MNTASPPKGVTARCVSRRMNRWSDNRAVISRGTGLSAAFDSIPLLSQFVGDSTGPGTSEFRLNSRSRSIGMQQGNHCERNRPADRFIVTRKRAPTAVRSLKPLQEIHRGFDVAPSPRSQRRETGGLERVLAFGIAPSMRRGILSRQQRGDDPSVGSFAHVSRLMRAEHHGGGAPIAVATLRCGEARVWWRDSAGTPPKRLSADR